MHLRNLDNMLQIFKSFTTRSKAPLSMITFPPVLSFPYQAVLYDSENISLHKVVVFVQFSPFAPAELGYFCRDFSDPYYSQNLCGAVQYREGWFGPLNSR